MYSTLFPASLASWWSGLDLCALPSCSLVTQCHEGTAGVRRLMMLSIRASDDSFLRVAVDVDVDDIAFVRHLQDFVTSAAILKREHRWVLGKCKRVRDEGDCILPDGAPLAINTASTRRFT